MKLILSDVKTRVKNNHLFKIYCTVLNYTLCRYFLCLTYLTGSNIFGKVLKIWKWQPINHYQIITVCLVWLVSCLNYFQQRVVIKIKK